VIPFGPCPCVMCQISNWSRLDLVPVWCAKYQSDPVWTLSLCDVSNIKLIPFGPCPCVMCQISKLSRLDLVPVWCAKYQIDPVWIVSLCDVPNIKVVPFGPCPRVMCQISKWTRLDRVPVWCAKYQSDPVWTLSPCDVRNIKVITESSSCTCGAMSLYISLDQLICVNTSNAFGWYPSAISVRIHTLTWCGIQFPADSAFPLTVFHLLDRWLMSVN